jgi:hypothetical protein
MQAKLGNHERAVAPGYRMITWRTEHRNGYTVEAGDPRVVVQFENRGSKSDVSADARGAL